MWRMLPRSGKSPSVAFDPAVAAKSRAKVSPERSYEADFCQIVTRQVSFARRNAPPQTKFKPRGRATRSMRQSVCSRSLVNASPITTASAAP